jgi:hypothetical protein
LTDLKQELDVKKAFGTSEDIVKKEKEDDAVTPTGSIESKKIVDNGLRSFLSLLLVKWKKNI